jgi:hypothetical protein
LIGHARFRLRADTQSSTTTPVEKKNGPPKRAVSIQPRVSNDTPSFDALTIVAPIVRFNALDILFAPDLDFAIVFNVRTSSFDHARRTTFCQNTQIARN